MATRRSRKKIAPAENLGIRMDPILVHEFARWAQKVGVTRSELGRMELEAALRRYRKRGPRWLKGQLATYKTTEGGDAGTENGVDAGMSQPLSGLEGLTLNHTKEIAL